MGCKLVVNAKNKRSVITRAIFVVKKMQIITRAIFVVKKMQIITRAIFVVTRAIFVVKKSQISKIVFLFEVEADTKKCEQVL